MTPPLTQLRRIVQLDGLRAVAFLAVFAHHALGAPLLWIGVDMFFIVSGYLITGILIESLDRPDYFRRFYYRRFLRISPPFYLTLAVVVLVSWPQYQHTWPWHALYVSNISQAILGTDGNLGPTWSLAIEEQFYLLWPLLIYVMPRRWRVWVIGGALVAAPLLRGVVTVMATSHFWVYYQLPTRIDTLAAGALVAVIQRDHPAAFRAVAGRAPAMAVGSVVAFGTLAAALPRFYTSANSLSFNTLGYSLLVAGLTAVLLVVIGAKHGITQRVLTSAPLVYLGTISYMAYLCHLPMLAVAGHLVSASGSGGKLVQAALGLTGTVAAAALSWRYFEQPILRLRARMRAAGDVAASDPSAALLE